MPEVVPVQLRQRHAPADLDVLDTSDATLAHAIAEPGEGRMEDVVVVDAEREAAAIREALQLARIPAAQDHRLLQEDADAELQQPLRYRQVVVGRNQYVREIHPHPLELVHGGDDP